MPNTPKLREDERLKIGEDGWTREYSECWHDGYGFGKRQAKKKLTQELSTLKAQVRKEIEELRHTSIKGDTSFHDFCYSEALTDCLSIPSLKKS